MDPAPTSVRGRVAALADAVRDAYEESPRAAHNLADKAMSAHWRRAERAAMADPVYAETEARHTATARVAVLLLSAKRNLGWDERKVREAVSDQIAPWPVWWPVAQYLNRRPMRCLTGAVTHRYQRATRGWSERDVWDLDTHLCATISAQLTHLADNAHGWPAGEDYPQFEDWTAALHQAASGLSGWANHEDSAPVNATMTAADGPEEEFSAAADLETGEDAARLAAAKDALRWVADNLDALWD